MKRVGSIIAMKGHPFTRKSEIATTIAASLGCPLLSYEHFLAELPPLSPEGEKEVFRIICNVARHQIWRISKAIVIDSPLSSAWHLEQLKEMAKFLCSRRLRVIIIIVECKPTHAYSWRLKFEEYMTRYSPSDLEEIPWYKPKKWEDVEKARKINPADYDEESVQDHEHVSKLVVDPVFLSSFDKRIAEAVKYMMTQHEKDGYHVVLYRQWKQLESSSTDLNCSMHGHKIVSKSAAEEGLQHEGPIDCAFCEKQVMMSDDDAYYYYDCKRCSLALHKDCAESSAPKGTEDGKYACRTCKGKGEDFSDDCGACIIETHLSTRRLPTVISHVDTEEHLLTDKVLSKKIHERNHCIACGQFNHGVSLFLCNICGLTYHYECATLPRRVMHEHGLHHHHLSLKFMSEEEEDYLCNECNQFRDPSVWFYSCEECPYELHPSCIRQDKVHESDSSVPGYDFDWEDYSVINRELVSNTFRF